MALGRDGCTPFGDADKVLCSTRQYAAYQNDISACRGGRTEAVSRTGGCSLPLGQVVESLQALIL